ncbi:trypsin-like peptidase domain-containing protein [Streptomyces fulvoviolaceus]|uniref:trypsin-like peptidase domain-containing protein n=1 Tax=Streptomyces fulvoviolaceus TaxID=285535 RepID=UPI000D11B598|nr:trypsin-like peptidase domain-containing protein [Streptomyces fulvoviolaceus]
MTQRHYWVRISEKGEHKGAGFRLGRGYVLTAMHCLKNVSSEDALLDVELPNGQTISGRLCDSRSDADLALIAVEDAYSQGRSLTATTDRPRPRARWSGTYSPPKENKPLSGSITHTDDYHGRDNIYFQGIYLIVDQNYDVFSGYSGSPVSTDPGVLVQPKAYLRRELPVVGILMDQQYSRADPNKPSNALVAASIDYAMHVFPQLNTGWLRNKLHHIHRPQDQAGSGTYTASGNDETAPPRTPGDVVDGQLKSLWQAEESGLITLVDAKKQRRLTVQRLGDQAAGGDSDV